MTLRALVAALGGDLYQGGYRANVPAPGHGAADRSMSLLLSNGRVVIHGFGGADWRVMRDALRRLGFIDERGRLIGEGRGTPSPPRPDRRVRRDAAARLWDGGVPINGTTAAGRYLHGRRVGCGAAALNLRHLPDAPVSVYRPCGRTRPALVARISDDRDRLTAVEITYLDEAGRNASGLDLTRKTVGLVPPGAAVRLALPAERMLVGEGVVTTLSAMDRFGLPGWALMSAHNLAAWSPPEGVRRVLIAADRGAVGEAAATRLGRRLQRDGFEVQAIWPDPPFEDWNAAAPASPEGERGRGRAPERRDWPVVRRRPTP